MIWRIFVMWMKQHWMKVIIIMAVVGLVVLAYVGLMSLESFYRHLTLATAPFQMLMMGFHSLVFVLLIWWIHYGKGFATMDKAPIKGKGIDIRWKDVIGMEDAKQEAWEVVQLIRDRTKLTQIGGRVVKGLLMIGPPGCGKTYLAKAIATEARLPFISMSGSEFTEIFVGVGASRVRKLFKRARNLAYGYGGCIVFIDELDAIGRNRQYGPWGGQETNSTQNQLLVEMDGLKEKGGNIVIIGATNAPENSLDKALLRPGRFDRKIYISIPGLEDREKIFKYYLSKVKVSGDINIGRLARRAVYKSPADIASLVTEAALIATRRRKDQVSMKELSEAFERIDLGIKHKITMTREEKEMVAYHESGHLIVVYMLHPTEDVFKASIIPRRGALGVVWKHPKEELHTLGKEKILADIKVSLAGYVAEKIIKGATSSGVSSDFSKAMAVAHSMVWEWGMGHSGFVGDYDQIPSEQLSEDIKYKLNMDTQKIIQDCLSEVEQLLKNERVILDRFAKELLEKEELDFDDIEAIFKEYNKEKKKFSSSG